MLKREIKYTDFNDQEVTDIFYFNLSKTEIIELEVKYPEGFTGMLQKIIETKNNRELVQQFKEIILLAYGEKSDDGKRFIKNEHLRAEFEQTAAYQELFLDLATHEDAAEVFLKGILPKDMVAAVEQDKPLQLPGVS